MDLQLTGKKAIVTGGTAGIGLAIARVLTEEGAEVTIPGRNSKKLSEAVSEHELPLRGPIRRIDTRDDVVLANIER